MDQLTEELISSVLQNLNKNSRLAQLLCYFSSLFLLSILGFMLYHRQIR